MQNNSIAENFQKFIQAALSIHLLKYTCNMCILFFPWCCRLLKTDALIISSKNDSTTIVNASVQEIIEPQTARNLVDMRRPCGNFPWFTDKFKMRRTHLRLTWRGAPTGMAARPSRRTHLRRTAISLKCGSTRGGLQLNRLIPDYVCSFDNGRLLHDYFSFSLILKNHECVSA